MYESLQPELVVVSTVMLVLSVLVLVLRFWSRHIIPGHSFGPDDWLALGTVPFMVVESVLIFTCITLGLGRPASSVSIADQQSLFKLLFISSFFFQTAIVLPKFSALAFYHRIFGCAHRWFHLSLWTLAVLNLAWLVAAYVLTSLQCLPISAVWQHTPEAQCLPEWQWLAGLAAPSVLIDLAILLLPMPILWRINADNRRKAILSVIFACGYCVLIVSLGRLVTLVSMRSALQSDPTYSPVRYLEWVQCEAPVSLIGISVPNIVQLGHRMRVHGRRFLLTGQTEIFPSNPREANELRNPWIAAAFANLPMDQPYRPGNSRLDSYSIRPQVMRKSVNFSMPRGSQLVELDASATRDTPNKPVSPVPLPQHARPPNARPIPQFSRWTQNDRRVHFMSDMTVGIDGRLYDRF